MPDRTAPALDTDAFEHAPAPLCVVVGDQAGWRIDRVNDALAGLLGAGAPAFRAAAAEATGGLGTALTTLAGNASTRVAGCVVPDLGSLALTAGRPRRVGNETVMVLQIEPVAGEPGEHDLRSVVQQLRDLVDNSTALMYIKDIEGRYVIVNQYFARLFGVPVEEIVGRTDRELFNTATADAYRHNDAEVVRTGRAIEVEEPYAAVHADADPERRWLSIKFPLLDDHGRPYALGAISTDITDRKRAEIAARDARLEAERANRTKDEFLSRMSHELRTPLNAILGFAQLLAQHDLPSAAADQVQYVLGAGRHLLSLVNDVLDISRIEAGALGLALEPTDAAAGLHQALEIVRPLAAERGIEISSDLHGALHKVVVADPQRLRQVFLNLLGNAIKFNRPAGAVRVTCHDAGSVLRYRVTDTGDGLTEADAQTLFTPFTRLKAAAQIEGSGLGLALSRRLIELMGGSIGIERTAPGEGSTFFVELPIATSARLDPHVAATVRAQLPRVRKATVVHIEDTPANRQLVESVLAGMGPLRLLSASTGEGGLALVRDAAADLVLLDLHLPDMSGTEVLDRLGAEPATRAVPVVVISADATPATVDRVMSRGATAYITKPIDIHGFAHAVAKALGR